MKLFLSSITPDPKEMLFTEKDSWVQGVIASVQEESEQLLRPINLRTKVYKSQDLYVVHSKIGGHLNLLCSRCIRGFDFPVAFEFRNLFTKNEEYSEEEKAFGTTGFATHHIENEDDTDTDMEFLDEEFIDMASTLRERLYLKLPLQPLCKESCKGLCTICGQDQNTEPCQCRRMQNDGLARGLKNIQLDSKLLASKENQ